jgi:putative ABC transport system permease protein
MWRFSRRREAELDEEVRTHLAMAERDRIDRGESPDVARTAVRREFGNVGLVKEITRELWGWPSVERLGQDLRYAARSLRRSPVFTLTAILTMTIGIGLNTAMFTAFNAVGLRGWPVENADTLVVIRSEDEGPARQSGFGLDELRDFQGQSRTLSVVAASRFAYHSVSIDPDATGQRAYGQYVTAGYFDATGVRMAMGRNFRPDEDREGAPAHVIIISHVLWQRVFGGAADVIGKSVYLGRTPNVAFPGESPDAGNAPYAIVGVTREGWRGGQPYRDDFWLPMQVLRNFRPTDPLFSLQARRCCAELLGRLSPGISREQASEELTTIARQRATAPEDRPRRAALSGTSIMDRTTGPIRLAIPLLVLVATLIVLLLTGANIAHLQLARAMARAREIRTRMALGAGRARVARQLLTEALLLSVCAGVLGMTMVYALLDTLMAVAEMPMPEVWTPDIKVFAYCVGVSLSMSIVFSLLPALRSTRISLLHGTGQAATPPGRLRFNLMLLTFQIALSTSLLTGASLLSRAFVRATTGDVGYSLSGLTTATFLPGRSDRSAAEVPANVPALRQALEQASAQSGLPHSALVEQLPFSFFDSVQARRLGDDPREARGLDLVRMSASAFEVIGIPLTAGRPYADAEGGTEAVVNETAARLLWRGEPALGKTLLVTGTSYTVVGVTRDVYYTSHETITPMLHLPVAAGRNPNVVVRAEGPAVTAQLNAILTGVDRRATVSVRTLSERLASRLRDGKAAARAAWAGGLLALALATFGVFGVFAYVVEERRREIGIRLALGAQKRQVLTALLRTARRAVLGGLTLGLLLSLCVGPLLEQVLLGLSPFDPIAFGIVAVILAAAGVLATFIPAQRALSVAPAVILKQDS